MMFCTLYLGMDAAEMSNAKCFIYSKTFGNKFEMMNHRKKNHSNIIKRCTKFVEGTCPFQENFCWYSHEKQSNESDNAPENEEKEEDDSSSVFR